MKTLFITLLCFVFSQSPVVAGQHIEEIYIKVVIHCDHCKKCESCGPRLKDAVFSLKGIKRVDIHEARQMVKVAYNPRKTTPAAIRQAIAHAGYSADDVPADPAAYKLLDACCKKEQ